MAFDQPVPIYVGMSILTAAVWLAVGARVCVRTCIVKPFTAGDWLMIFTALIYTATVGLLFRFCVLIAGTNWASSDPTMASVLLESTISSKCIYLFTSCLYLLSTITLKLSIALLLLRFCQSVSRRIIIWTTVFYTIYCITIACIVMFQCSPVSAFWDVTITDRKCINNRVITALVYSQAATSLVTDAIYAVVPIFLISKIKMSLKTKLSVSCVLGLGLSTSVVNIARLCFVDGLHADLGISNNLYPISICSLLEIGIGLIAACMATLRPLIRKMSKSAGSQDIEETKACHSKTADDLIGQNKVSRIPSTGTFIGDDLEDEIQSCTSTDLEMGEVIVADSEKGLESSLRPTTKLRKASFAGSLFLR